MKTNFRKDSVIVINTWAETLEQQKLLLDCITNLDLLDIDICLVSHYPISTVVQNLVTYYVYDKNNELSEMDNKTWYWHYYPIKIFLNRLLKSFYSHHPAVLDNIKNSFYMAKARNKKYVFFMDNDAIINISDLHSFYDIYEETLNSNKKAWFETYQIIKNNKDVDSVNCDFFFSDVDFMIDNIDFSKTIWELGLEHHIFTCLKNVKDEYILNIRNEKIPYESKFPNSAINQMHSKPPIHSKDINPKIKNFHLLGNVLLSENKKNGLKPMLVIINHWNRENKSQTFNNSMFSDKDNIFNISYFIDDKLISSDEITLNKPNSSYYKQFNNIEDKNTYRVEVDLYNEYTREWDWFYNKEWTLDDINDMKKDGNYDFFEKN
jgi:hypothetical protein